MTNDRLTQLELNFCHEYIKDGHGTNAYLRAKDGSVTRDAAKTEASVMLAKDRVRAYLEVLRSEVAIRTGVTIDKIVSESSCLAFSDINDFIELDGENLKIKDLQSLPRHVTSAIKRIKLGRDGSLVIDLHDKNTALDRLAKIYGLYTDFNQAVATLRRYGKQLTVNGNDWSLSDIEPEN